MKAYDIKSTAHARSLLQRRMAWRAPVITDLEAKVNFIKAEMRNYRASGEEPTSYIKGMLSEIRGTIQMMAADQRLDRYQVKVIGELEAAHHVLDFTVDLLNDVVQENNRLRKALLGTEEA